MARSYDNWERLVTATLKREDLRRTAQRTPSELSLASESSFSSFNLASSSRRLSSFDLSSLLVGDSLSYQQILEATDNLSESKLIKHGNSGDLFYGVLKGGTQVIAKKIDLSLVTKKSLFIAELEILRKVSLHHRFVPLVGHCLENKKKKFLVYKHMANKDLSTSLSVEQSPFLNWTTRLKIATEVAEGLCYLHQCVPPVAHSNIQASSILLDDKFNVRLSLYEVCAEGNDMLQNAISRAFRHFILNILRAFGQDTTGTSNESYALCSYDVYSFGKILLELVTGKLGLSATDDSTTNGWIANVLSYILPDNADLIINIISSSLLLAKHAVAQVWAVSFVAKACLSPESSKRPQMAQILLALEHIKSSSFTAESSKTTGNHDYWYSVRAMEIAEILWGSKLEGRTALATAYTETLGTGAASRTHGISQAGGSEETYPNGGVFAQPSLTIFSYSELKDATRNFTSRSSISVREDEFGRVYQAWLPDKSSSNHGNGSLVAVRNVSSQYMSWQEKETKLSRIHSLGRLSHPNLVKFLGYCEEKELFVVHEFMRSGNLDNHLSRAGSDVQPLSWEMRLNILIGAARGLAFLHATEKHGFYEYFGTSDILLDGTYNAKISGFGTSWIPGFPNEVHPIIFSTYADAPPEKVIYIEDAGPMDVKSDVYGFGVVLAAMLSGLSTLDRTKGLSTLDTTKGPTWIKVNRVLGFEKIGRATLKTIMDPKVNRVLGFEKIGRATLKTIMDPKLEGQYSFKAAQKLGSLASACLRSHPNSRPSMEVVVKVLESVAAAREET